MIKLGSSILIPLAVLLLGTHATAQKQQSGLGFRSWPIGKIDEPGFLRAVDFPHSKALEEILTKISAGQVDQARVIAEQSVLSSGELSDFRILIDVARLQNSLAALLSTWSAAKPAKGGTRELALALGAVINAKDLGKGLGIDLRVLETLRSHSNDRDPYVLTSVGWALWQITSLDEGRLVLERAIDQAPTLDRLRMSVATSYLSSENEVSMDVNRGQVNPLRSNRPSERREDLALKHLVFAIDAKTTYAPVYKLAGALYLKAGQKTEALANFELYLRHTTAPLTEREVIEAEVRKLRSKPFG